MTRADKDQASRLACLYEAHGPGAKRLAYLLTGDNHLAEDLVQDAFAKLGGRFMDLRNPDAFPSYLKRTIVNLSRMHFRRRTLERAYAARRSADSRISIGHEPDIARRDAMREALLSLPMRQRAVIVFRFYEDLSEAQVAEILRCPIGTVKTLSYRGLANLRTHLGGEWDGE